MNRTIEEYKILVPYGRVSMEIQATEEKTGIPRQLESARKCALEHGWKIDETFTLVDAGKSGYHGKNLEPEAALGGLIKALRAGKIPLKPTRVLHIDDMSRFSRIATRKARNLFEEIIDLGMEIYDAEDNKLHDKASLDNFTDGVMRLLRHEESHKYSARLAKKISDSYTIRKQRLIDTGKPYQAKTHGWLGWNNDKKEYVEMDGHKQWDAVDDRLVYLEKYDPTQDKVKSVNRLFQLAKMGLGWRAIAMRMNAEKHPILGTYCGKKIKSHRWNITSIRRVIEGKAVLGLNENLTPPLKMFPAVIDEKLYWDARSALSKRSHIPEKGKTAIRECGRNWDTATNLFQGLTKCKYCDCAIYYGVKPTNQNWKKRNPETFGSRGGVGSRGSSRLNIHTTCVQDMSTEDVMLCNSVMNMLKNHLQWQCRNRFQK